MSKSGRFYFLDPLSSLFLSDFPRIEALPERGGGAVSLTVMKTLLENYDISRPHRRLEVGRDTVIDKARPSRHF